MSIQRQATHILTGLYVMCPKLDQVISLRTAKDLISAMAVAGMFVNDSFVKLNAYTNETSSRVNASINYEFSIRAIARSIGINEYIASKFIRNCFIANKFEYMYPHTENVFGSEYECVVPHVTAQLAPYVIEFLAGDNYLPIQPDTDIKSKYSSRDRIHKDKYGTFYLLREFAKIKETRSDLPAKLYLLEVIEYIRSHPDRRIPRGEFTPRKIFIDEIIDYAREYDEIRFNQFHDEIGELMLLYNDCAVLPDCHAFKKMVKLDKLHGEIKLFDSVFANLIGPEKLEPEQCEYPEAELVSDGKESKSDACDNCDAPAPAEVTAVAIVPQRARQTVDQQFEDDTARAIALSIQDALTAVSN